MTFVLEFWHWWALALMFVVVEALLLSGVFAAFAIAGLITGIAFNMYPTLDWKLQLVIFATATIIFQFIFRSLFKKKLDESAEDLHKPSELIGKELVLRFPIQNGFSEIEIDGVNWALKGPDLKAGTTVKVVGVDGNYLSVFPFTPQKDEANIEQEKE